MHKPAYANGYTPVVKASASSRRRDPDGRKRRDWLVEWIYIGSQSISQLAHTSPRGSLTPSQLIPTDPPGSHSPSQLFPTDPEGPTRQASSSQLTPRVTLAKPALPN